MAVLLLSPVLTCVFVSVMVCQVINSYGVQYEST